MGVTWFSLEERILWRETRKQMELHNRFVPEVFVNFWIHCSTKHEQLGGG